MVRDYNAEEFNVWTLQSLLISYTFPHSRVSKSSYVSRIHFVLVRRTKQAEYTSDRRSEDGIKVLNIYHLTPPSPSGPARWHISDGSQVSFMNDTYEFGKTREFFFTVFRPLSVNVT